MQYAHKNMHLMYQLYDMCSIFNDKAKRTIFIII